MKSIPALTLLLLLVPASPALAAKIRTENFAYRITSAKGTETLTFQGDGTSTCASAGLCGYSGTVTYTFGGARHGVAALSVASLGGLSSAFGEGDFATRGLTSANVVEAGVAQPCIDTVKHDRDGFAMDLAGSTVEIGFHAPVIGEDFLNTRCAGPSETDMLNADALPLASVSLRRFRKHRVSFGFTSDQPFHEGPFMGRLKVDAAFTLVRDRKAERQAKKVLGKLIGV